MIIRHLTKKEIEFLRRDKQRIHKEVEELIKKDSESPKEIKGEEKGDKKTRD